MMVQQYLPAIETEGEWSLIYFDDNSVTRCASGRGPSDFRVQKDHGGSVEMQLRRTRISWLCRGRLRLLHSAPATFARVDLVEQDGKIYLMEMEVIEPELFLNLALQFGSAAAIQF